MFGLGKKKDKSMKNEDPPLPEELPPMPDDLKGPMPSMQPETSSDQVFQMPSDQLPEMREMPPDLSTNHPEILPTQSKMQSRRMLPTQPEMPPMPDALPEMQEMPPEIPPLENIHDQIPNDFDLQNAPPLEESEPNYSPENLPDLEEEPELPPQESYAPSMPNRVESKSLPPLPETPDISDFADAPAPEIDDEVPKPPAIFSDESFYETPNEIKHLVGEKRPVKVMKPKEISLSEKYHLDEVEEDIEQAEVEKPELKYESEGPIFVDIAAFRTILADIDGIKNDIKSSNEILHHLNEIKNSKDNEFEKWRASLEDMQRKINYIDTIVFKEA